MISTDASITQIIREYSSNKEVSFYGKFLWLTNELAVHPIEILMKDGERNRQGKPQKTHYTSVIPKEWTTCCMKTHAALMVSFFGVDFENIKNPRLTTLGPDASSGLNQVRRIIDLKEKFLSGGVRQSQEIPVNGLDERHGMVYSFRIFCVHAWDKSVIHAFTLLHIAEQGKPVLKLLQSYADQYSFEDSHAIDKTISKGECFIMFDMLNELASSRQWCSDELFYRFFNAMPPVPTKGKAIDPIKIEIRCGYTSSKLMKNIEAQYTSIFPKNRKIKFAQI